MSDLDTAIRHAVETLAWIESRQGPLPDGGYARIETTVGTVKRLAAPSGTGGRIVNAEPCWCGHSEYAHLAALVCVVCPNPPASHTYEPVTSVRREIARLRAEVERLKSLTGME